MHVANWTCITQSTAFRIALRHMNALRFHITLRTGVLLLRLRSNVGRLPV